MKRALLAVTIGLALVVTARRCGGHRVDRCRLEQRWEAGDVHRFEGLELRPDATGHWNMGSYDEAIEPRERDITWARDGKTLTIDGASVPFDTEDHETWCTLHFHAYPLDGSHELYWYSPRETP